MRAKIVGRLFIFVLFRLNFLPARVFVAITANAVQWPITNVSFLIWNKIFTTTAATCRYNNNNDGQRHRVPRCTWDAHGLHVDAIAAMWLVQHWLVWWMVLHGAVVSTSMLALNPLPYPLPRRTHRVPRLFHCRYQTGKAVWLQEPHGPPLGMAKARRQPNVE